jgi:hypothetical protein
MHSVNNKCGCTTVVVCTHSFDPRDSGAEKKTLKVCNMVYIGYVHYIIDI